MYELLTNEEMRRADALAIASGVPGIELMEAAGAAVAHEVVTRFPEADLICVLCGPGNNGGDGFVAARHLLEQGYRVRLSLVGDPAALKGDAAVMAERWRGGVEPVGVASIAGADVVIDAIFGAGLSRAPEGRAREVIDTVNASGVPVIAVDIPSGVDGTTGAVPGAAIRATATVTFFRMKPGHLLLPGRLYCGAVSLAAIGIHEALLGVIEPQTFANVPELWRPLFPWPSIDAHKYQRGSCVVVSGGAEGTGAARLGARAALRSGAGLVTLAGSKAATAVNAAHSTAVMVASFQGRKGLAQVLGHKRASSVLIGPAAGVGARTAGLVREVLESGAVCVLDADALTSFESRPDNLFRAIERNQASVVMTPHEGEFRRLFRSRVAGASKLERARTAARQSHAVMVLKGPDTVIAAPDGRAAINSNASRWLATAGSGDVLAGIIAGLAAQGMPAFEAACAAAWLHGETGARGGPGLIAED
ncbi:MAG: NAD(P)H-hydrate dehydratase, partial [Alphaproteobacteria bacterium]